MTPEGTFSTRSTVLPALYVEEVSSEGSAMASSDTHTRGDQKVAEKGNADL